MSKHGNKSRNLIVSIVAMLSYASFTYGASFDCKKASSNVEKMICADGELSRLDSELDVAYKNVLATENNIPEIKANQKQWLVERNSCTNRECIKTAYEKHIKTLASSVDAKDSENSGVSSGNELSTVRIEVLGENWHYKHDSDKVPVIQSAMARVVLGPDPRKGNRAPYCQLFKQDFLEGKFQVIEHELQILSLTDKHLDKRWHQCDAIDRENSTATSNDRVFEGFPYFSGGKYAGKAEPPYRFYRIQLKNNDKGEKTDVVEFRLARDPPKIGYWYLYLSVNLPGCELLSQVPVYSAKEVNSNWADAISLLIRYEGRAMVLSFQSYPSYGSYAHGLNANPSDPEHFRIQLTDLAHDKDFCLWETSVQPDQDKKYIPHKQ